MNTCWRRAPRRRRTGLVLLAASLFVLGSCRTSAEVAVVVDDDGSGEVTVAVGVDAEAVEFLGGPENLALDDVRESGWDMAAPDVAADGGFEVVAVRGFADEDELAQVLADVAGEDVFTSVSTEIDESFGRTTHSASLEVAVTGDPAQFSDDALAEVLGGLPLGRTPEELAAAGASGPGVATLTVSVVVPGAAPDTAELDLASGDAQQATVASENTEYRPAGLGAAAVGVLLLVTGLVVGIVALVRSRRR